VDLHELWGSEEVGRAPEELDIVRNLEFLEEPDDAVGTRLFEPSIVTKSATALPLVSSRATGCRDCML
jgi:hypothetical protein